MPPHILWLLISDWGGRGLYSIPNLSPGGLWLWYWWFPSPYSNLHNFVYVLTHLIPCLFCTDLKCHIKSQFTIYKLWVILDTQSLFSPTFIAGFAQLPKFTFVQLATGKLFVVLGMQDPPTPNSYHHMPCLSHTASCACVPISNTLVSSHPYPLLYIMTLHKYFIIHKKKLLYTSISFKIMICLYISIIKNFAKVKQIR